MSVIQSPNRNIYSSSKSMENLKRLAELSGRLNKLHV